MNLNINSPSYFTFHYGVIDEIYSMCLQISRSVDVKKYTDSLDSIAITPIIAPEDEIKKGNWKEIKKVLVKSRLAIISLHIDYAKFENAKIDEKKALVYENIVSSLRVIQSSLKEKFNCDRMVSDITQIYADAIK